MEQERKNQTGMINPNVNYSNMNMNSMALGGNMNMPPYMYGKCMNMTIDNNPCNSFLMSYMDNNYKHYCSRGDMYMNPYMMKNIEPIENMYGNTYSVLIVYVRKTMQNIMMENMGVIPNSISKEKFNDHVNDMMCDMLKEEEKIMKMLMTKRDETEEQNEERSSCPLCRTMIKDTLTILFITELLKSGCNSCY